MLRRRKPAPPPAREPLTSWHAAAHVLLAEGFERAECPKTCRRKNFHAHLRHEEAQAEAVIYPAAS